MKNEFLKKVFKWNLPIFIFGILFLFNTKPIFGHSSSSSRADKKIEISEDYTLFILIDTGKITQNDIIYKDSARLAIEERTRKAYKRSMIIPGWGQVTNGGLWWIKVPIIYGGFVTSGLVIEFNNRYYQSILKDVQYRIANNHAMPPNSPYSYIAADPQGTQYLITAKDYYRRNRDITVFITIGWYALNIIEAYADSMLKFRWEVGDDIQAKWTPTIMPIHPGQTNQMAMGIKFKFNLSQQKYKP